MRTLALITARGGSKRIPRKNIKLFFGKPIIAWSIETAVKSGLFDEVMVSTEDNEIAEISKKYGANVPFIRSAKNADDMAGTEEVILEVLYSYEKMNKKFDLVCCIYPATPLMTAARLIECRDKLLQGKYDTLFPVLRYAHPLQRALKIEENKIKMVWPEFEDTRTQDLEVYYHDAGQYYWLDIPEFKKRKQLYSANSGCMELSEMEAQDIDNLDDWELAELKFRKVNKIEY